MGRTKTMDRVRRVVDDAMIFASLMVLAWPVLFGGLTRRNTNVLSWALPLGLVVLIGAILVKAAGRWPLAQYAPASAAVIMAAILHARAGGAGGTLTWLIIAIATIVLVRQFLGAGTNAGLMRDLSRQRAILARRDPLTELGNRAMFMEHAEQALDGAGDTMTAVIV